MKGFADGIRVVRKGGGQPSRGGSLRLPVRWAVSEDLVGARWLCGGWLELPAGESLDWRAYPAHELAWYVATGVLRLSWRAAGGEGTAVIRGGTFLYLAPGTSLAKMVEEGCSGLMLFAGAASPEALGGVGLP